MRLRRVGLVSVALAAVGLQGTACTPPPNELTFTVSRYGEVSSDGHFVTLHGTLSCDRPANVVDLDQMEVVGGFKADNTPTLQCEGPETQSWTQTFYDADFVQEPRSTATGYVEAWLLDPHDEDSDDTVVVRRTLTLTRG